MKKVIVLISIIIFLTNKGIAQNRKFSFSAGPAILIPTFSEINSAGFGIGAGIEYNLSKKISIVSDIDLNIFNSKVKNIFTNEITDGFIIMPLLVGLKWIAFKNFYFTGKSGVVAGLKNAGTNHSLSSGIGYLIPIGGKPKFDIDLKLVGVLPQTSIPENAFLEKGGYSFLSLKLAYRF